MTLNDRFNDPEPIRFLDVDGRFAPSASAAEYAEELDGLQEADLVRFYRDMALTRAMDTECTNLQRQGQLALWAPSVGQEAAQVGTGRAAGPKDHIFPSYREHSVARLRGVTALEVIAQFRGVSHGGWDPFDPAKGNFHLYTLVIGSQSLHATGYALGQLLDATREAGVTALDPGSDPTPTGQGSLVYFGDGATSQGDVSEALTFAASYQTPQVFVMQNNRWAISVPVTRQSRTPIYRRALGFGIPAVQTDGNDVLANYAVSRRMLANATSGGGPGFIEALTYRIGAHTTSDDPTRYRENEELEAWRLKDPIERFARYLRAEGVAESAFEAIEDESRELAAEVRAGVLSMPEPEPDAMFQHVYAAEHPRIEEQRTWLDRYESSFEEGSA
ncbi:thiamine pyrophosphate-dependent enzyme [Leucobacter sp. M11]|uniref:thiamine pyrophosphate-dependent enzyme n=1 Tax=Leucobacter sp. M11 TaxID=2993565 RepID=UPI002D806397|nr:thiamine pyrophosphate-dependent enzyme [Leucobacter sp. M11]MEB4614862.1 thiamine pyrophosphate-dependent enzyme [Leucobacter sp. M11]